jgi:TPP-dependent 2-oxoacid decarboxylase
MIDQSWSMGNKTELMIEVGPSERAFSWKFAAQIRETRKFYEACKLFLPNGTASCRIDQESWSKHTKTGNIYQINISNTNLSQTIQNYPKLYKITPNYTKLPPTIQNYPKLYKITPNYTKLPQTIQNYPKLYKITINNTKLSQTIQNYHTFTNIFHSKAFKKNTQIGFFGMKMIHLSALFQGPIFKL